MAKVTYCPPPKIEGRVFLELSTNEIKAIAFLTGRIIGNTKFNNICSSLYDSIYDAEIPELEELSNLESASIFDSSKFDFKNAFSGN